MNNGTPLLRETSARGNLAGNFRGSLNFWTICESPRCRALECQPSACRGPWPAHPQGPGAGPRQGGSADGGVVDVCRLRRGEETGAKSGNSTVWCPQRKRGLEAKGRSSPQPRRCQGHEGHQRRAHPAHPRLPTGAPAVLHLQEAASTRRFGRRCRAGTNRNALGLGAWAPAPSAGGLRERGVDSVVPGTRTTLRVQSRSQHIEEQTPSPDSTPGCCGRGVFCPSRPPAHTQLLLPPRAPRGHLGFSSSRGFCNALLTSAPFTDEKGCAHPRVSTGHGSAPNTSFFTEHNVPSSALRVPPTAATSTQTPCGRRASLSRVAVWGAPQIKARES